ncbi:MAG: sulfate ABC transporter permease subunit CysW [Lachnospiraceae bacterium]|nr:sulfate ABC transporter permease subunit CysW [Lachnospiraceae bacterium]
MELRNNRGPVKWFLILLSAAFLVIMLILPLAYVLVTAFREGIGVFVRAVTDSNALRSILLTLEASVFAVVINSVFGLFAAWTLTKYRFKGKKLLSTLIDLPLTISPVIAGLIFLLTYGRKSILYPLLHQWKISIVFAVPGIILATVFVTFPFISRELIPVLSAQGTDEEEAAALMGAGTFRIFREVTFPHVRWAFLYGVVLCAARAMGEFGAVSVLSGHLQGLTTTMPLYVELLYQGYDFTGAFAMSAILVVLAVLVLLLRNILEHRGGKNQEGIHQ